MEENKDIYPYALWLLGRKNYFINELKAALLKKYPEEDPQPAISRLIQDRYLDDERLLASYVRWKVSSGYGPYYIKEKLRGKGVNMDIGRINQAIRTEELDLDEIIRQTIRKYRRTRKKQVDAAFIRSCMGYLSYRGFAGEQSLKILKEEVTDNESNFFEGC